MGKHYSRIVSAIVSDEPRRWLLFAAGLLALHLITLFLAHSMLTVLTAQLGFGQEVALALGLLLICLRLLKATTQSALLNGYATGHFDGMEDAALD
jgi:cyanate permease